MTLTATASASDGGTLTYQWKKDGTNISGATSASYTISSFTAADAGSYTCEVTNTKGSNDPAKTTSDAVNLTLKTKPAMTFAVKNNDSAKLSGWDLGDVLTINGLESGDTAAKLFGAMTVSGTDYVSAKGGATVTFYKEVTAGGTTTYEKTTTLEEDTVYYADVAVTGTGLADYNVTAKAAVGSAPEAATLEQFSKITFKKAASGGIVIGGGSSSSYTVKFTAGAHGTLSGTTSVKVKSGESVVTLPSVTPNEGYTFRGWSIDGKTVVDPSTVEIKANTTFTALYNVVKNTYISGYPDGSFRPDATVTRAEIASMLARLSKDFNANSSYNGTANDVTANAWYANAVNFGMQKGIISGHQDGGFHPNENITRAEFASMLARYLGLSTGNKQFADTVDHWAASSIAALADAGIVTGRPDGGFDPNASLTRAEAVQMLSVALKITSGSVDYENVPNDVPATHWAYNQILTAMNSDIKDIVK